MEITLRSWNQRRVADSLLPKSAVLCFCGLHVLCCGLQAYPDDEANPEEEYSKIIEMGTEKMYIAGCAVIPSRLSAGGSQHSCPSWA